MKNGCFLLRNGESRSKRGCWLVCRWRMDVSDKTLTADPASWNTHRTEGPMFVGEKADDLFVSKVAERKSRWNVRVRVAVEHGNSVFDVRFSAFGTRYSAEKTFSEHRTQNTGNLIKRRPGSFSFRTRFVCSAVLRVVR